MAGEMPVERPAFLTYAGVDRRGGGVTGTLPIGEGAAFVERCYRARWQRLSLKLGDIEMGGIDLRPWDCTVKAKRIWWVDTDA